MDIFKDLTTNQGIPVSDNAGVFNPYIAQHTGKIEGTVITEKPADVETRRCI
jgi:hypothetical protein